MQTISLKRLLLILFIALSGSIFGQLPSNVHPSLLIQQGDEQLVKLAIKKSPELKIIHDIIISQSDSLLDMPCLKYEKIGYRLLDVSRECLRRVFYLSYSYRITGENKYAARAESEMLAVCAFADWNPSHFLDVAEMTMGVAIGYDWTFNYLPEKSKKIISNAILTNGLNPSFNEKYNWFLRTTINWNQVCNAGMLFGAIAIRDNEPELSKTIIDRSMKSVLDAMAGYEPYGNYTEGFSYWGYGTTLNVFLISVAEKFYGKELFPANNMHGFIKSATYMLNMVGPTGKCFNYSDCREKADFNPAIFWFAQKTNDPALLWNEKKFLTTKNTELRNERFLPAAILWGATIDFKKDIKPKSKFWLGQSTTPVCLMRSSWTDKNAVFLGFKAGSAATNHAHMDIGSFVMDALGVRWAGDLGMQEYNTLESKGIDLWGIKQNSQRWRIFRYNNFAHNTLAFNDSLQRVNGIAKFESWSEKNDSLSATSDLTNIYAGQVKKSIRTASLIKNSYVSIKDEIETHNAPTKLRWTVLTEAQPRLIQAENTIELTNSTLTD